MIFSNAAPGDISLEAALLSVAERPRVWLALSGGLDSVCLLRLAISAHQRLQCEGQRVPALAAIHVNHQLQSAASEFEHFCCTLCDNVGIALKVLHPQVTESGQGLEAAAREARYRAFGECVAANEVVWLAHHRNDQAETFLLRSLRGSGLTGLSAMPPQRPLGKGILQRPLLSFRRAELEALAREQGWSWVEDPSNATLAFSRNYLRHRVIPALEKEWPHAVGSLAGCAEQLGEQRQLLEEYAAQDLADIELTPGVLDQAALLALSSTRAALLIRHALSQRALATPPRAVMAQLLRQLEARPDSVAEVKWADVVARLWRGRLYMERAREAPDAGYWQRLLVQWQPCRQDGAAASLWCQPRQGGERLLVGQQHRRVKQLLQEADIPPWQRHWVGVVYYAGNNNEPVALLGERWSRFADGWQAGSHYSFGN
ncbi:tRNA lysidine(34) synthetase TilS [Carnimonas nigrificans]|uniref:tRNA lysidine(34) synthetase TilS n=1 Tax=Carnimonas nigrificans TaxID=64323 RepID=UPI00046FBAE6|nr:tRNA lysidine(34) synthetase TilS [Carnimonas nigrificans]